MIPVLDSFEMSAGDLKVDLMILILSVFGNTLLHLAFPTV